jgi:plastocyanin
LRSAALLATVTLVLPATLAAGTVKGRVELIEKGGRRATDLSDVVVYVDGARAKPRPARGAPAVEPLPKVTMTMKGKGFIPRVVVIPVGGTVEFPNEDPIFHNVFSVSGDNRFDLDLYKRPKSSSWTFQRAGVARVYCNIHPQMSGVVVVRDNPYFAKAGQDGTFAIPDVPAGKYTLKAWNERTDEPAREVTVPAQGDVEVSLTLDASSFKRVSHKNKFGKDYAGDEKY